MSYDVLITAIPQITKPVKITEGTEYEVCKRITKSLGTQFDKKQFKTVRLHPYYISLQYKGKEIFRIADRDGRKWFSVCVDGIEKELKGKSPFVRQYVTAGNHWRAYVKSFDEILTYTDIVARCCKAVDYERGHGLDICDINKKKY